MLINSMERRDGTRIILESQGQYVSVKNEQLVHVGSRGTEKWVDAGGGGDFLDPSRKQKAILEEHGSPVIVYPSGKIEKPQSQGEN